MRRLASLELALAIIGCLLLAIYVGVRIHGSILSRAEVQRFKSEQTPSRKQSLQVVLAASSPDFSLWSEKRIKDYQQSLAVHFAPASAILRIPKIHLEVPVLDGTDDLTLNRGVGLIAGTTRPGDNGNIAIAGHRDGFFRGLKDVALGDTIEIDTQTETNTYRIDRMIIVDPTDVSVLAPREQPSVTLVTCYPFYFVGSAPQRYIVQASRVNSNARESAQQNSKLHFREKDVMANVK